jgi:hypothetical protein
MELDRALELVVASSWRDLVKPGEACTVRVEYNNILNMPLESVEVWASKSRGYGSLVCRYGAALANDVSPSSKAAEATFANSYSSKTLAEGLAFVMRNQDRFTRAPGRSVHGVVRIDSPAEEARGDASPWKQAVLAEYSDTVWN